MHAHFFFFHRYRDHRDLPSFPTRRSSDLSGTRCMASSFASRSSSRISILVSRSARLVTSVRVDDLDAKRSEEHTSELQSQSNLVCRLLLEKKKIMTGKRSPNVCNGPPPAA